MPQIDWRHNRRQLFLPVAIFPSLSAPNPHHSELITGLIDTGATASGLRPDIIAQLVLEKRGKRVVGTANGEIVADRFLVRFGFFPGSFGELPFDLASSHPFVLDREFFVHALHPHFPHQMLIGMDLLGISDLNIDRSGKVRLVLP